MPEVPQLQNVNMIDGRLVARKEKEVITLLAAEQIFANRLIAINKDGKAVLASSLVGKDNDLKQAIGHTTDEAMVDEIVVVNLGQRNIAIKPDDVAVPLVKGQPVFLDVEGQITITPKKSPVLPADLEYMHQRIGIAANDEKILMDIQEFIQLDDTVVKYDSSVA